MNAPESISPKDTAILQNLKKQEEKGEQGFAVFYRGDQETGSQIIKQAFDVSATDVRALKNSYLRQNAEELLNEMNTALKNYMKQPSDENLSALKTEAENYKSFLDKY